MKYSSPSLQLDHNHSDRTLKQYFSIKYPSQFASALGFSATHQNTAETVSSSAFATNSSLQCKRKGDEPARAHTHTPFTVSLLRTPLLNIPGILEGVQTLKVL